MLITTADPAQLGRSHIQFASWKNIVLRKSMENFQGELEGDDKWDFL